MSSVDSQVEHGRRHRVIMLDAPSQSSEDSWSTIVEDAPNDAAAQPQPAADAHEILDVTQLDNLVLDVAADPPVFALGDLLGWPVEARRNLFRFVSDMPRRYSVRRGISGELYTDLFDLVIDLMEGDDDVVRCEAGRRAAIEAAAYLHPRETIPCGNRIVRRLRELGVAGVRAGGIQREIQSLIDELNSRPLSTSARVRDLLADAPVADACTVPQRWVLSASGISIFEGNPICSVPAVIVGRYVSATSPDQFLIAFRRDRQWHRRLVERRQLATVANIQRLASVGLPVDATNARQLVQFFHDFESENRDAIPVLSTSDQLGWQEADDPTTFLLPQQAITPEGVAYTRPTSLRGPEDFMSDSMVFVAPHEVAADITSGLRAHGCYDGWIDTVNAIAPFHRVRLAIYASLATPLLPILGAPNFVVDLAGPTSGGKTTTLAVAASCWGNPNENDSDSFIQSWDSTAAFRETALATCNGVPLFLDETRIADGDGEVTKTVYSVVKGRKRGRRHRGSTGDLGGSSTIAFSTGEAPISSMTQQGGVRARVVPIWGSPFGATNQNIDRVIQGLISGISENFGFAGPAVVHNLLDHRDHWNWLRQWYRRRRAELAERAGDRSGVCRLAAPLATISIAAWLAHQSLRLAWDFEDPVDLLWNDLVSEGQDADRAENALEFVISWAVAHQDSFLGRRRAGLSQPLGGWSGRWDPGGNWLGFVPNVLSRILRGQGYDADPIVRMWRDRNWILVDRSSGKARHRARLGGENAWLVAIRREVIDPIIGDD